MQDETQDIANDHLVVGTIRIKIAKYKPNQKIRRRSKFAVEKLKDPDLKTTYANEVEKSIREIADLQ